MGRIEGVRIYPFRLKLTEYYWYGLKQCIPRVFDDFLIGPKIRLMGPPPFNIRLYQEKET